jgi:MFS family permease
MVQKKRIAIATAIGILTGLYCAGSLLVFAPPGITPEPWFMVMIFYGRTIQGFVIGFANGIPLQPVMRGAGLGAIMSLLLCIVPLFAHNYFGAVMLLVFGIIYGVLTDWIASRLMQKNAEKPAGMPAGSDRV